MIDKLDDIFHKRNSFMKEIQSKFPNSYPEQWPINISEKSSQTILRETALKGVEEMFEALQHLKNWKSHRETDMPEIDREEFLEEIVDAFNYFFSLMILIGVDVDEFYSAFNSKDEIIRRRLDKGY
tara:strand:- start:6892 stop:7269 length:378 start_codon:yes stop_codon:yes gene_type:complete